MHRCRKLVPLRSHNEHSWEWLQGLLSDRRPISSVSIADGESVRKRARSPRSHVDNSRNWAQDFGPQSRFSSASTTDGEGVRKRARSLRVPTYMVWGADTDVGKTLISSGLAHSSAVSQVLGAKISHPLQLLHDSRFSVVPLLITQRSAPAQAIGTMLSNF